MVGKPVARLDIPGKVTGQFTYMHDFQVPGMLHGRVVRPAALDATLESVDESFVRDIPGIVKIVRQGNFLGIVAKSEWSAVCAARKIKATWSKSETLPSRPNSGSTSETPKSSRTTLPALSAIALLRWRLKARRLVLPMILLSTLTGRSVHPALSPSSGTGS